MLKKLGKVSRLRNSSSEVGEYDICRREREGERERGRERGRGGGGERGKKKSEIGEGGINNIICRAEGTIHSYLHV